MSRMLLFFDPLMICLAWSAANSRWSTQFSPGLCTREATSTDYFVRPYVCICNTVCLSTGIALDLVFCYMLLFNNKCISDWFFCQVLRRIGSQ